VAGGAGGGVERGLEADFARSAGGEGIRTDQSGADPGEGGGTEGGGLGVARAHDRSAK
jgi:hypothetical protein